MTGNKSDNPNIMKESEKITLIIDIIKRYDNYIVSTNTKASLLIAINSLILGTVLLKFSEILSFYCSPTIKGVVGFLLVIISASSLLSLFFVFIVVYPYFRSKENNKKQQGSLIYFGSVSEMSGQEYFNNLNSVTIEGLIADLSQQATILAGILKKKMLLMRHGIETIMVSVSLAMALVIIKAAMFFW